MPRLSSTQTAPLAAAAGGAASSAAACAAEPSAADPTAAAAGGGGDDVSMADADAHCSTEAFGDEAMQDGDLEDHMHDYDGGKMQGGGSSSTGVTAAGGAASGGVQVVASFLATCEAAAAEGDDAVAAGGDDYDGGEGYEDDGCGWEQQQQDRRQSLLGLGDEQVRRKRAGGGDGVQYLGHLVDTHTWLSPFLSLRLAAPVSAATVLPCAYRFAGPSASSPILFRLPQCHQSHGRAVRQSSPAFCGVIVSLTACLLDVPCPSACLLPCLPALLLPPQHCPPAPGHDSCSALNAEALQHLLGAAAGGGSSSSAGGTTLRAH